MYITIINILIFVIVIIILLSFLLSYYFIAIAFIIINIIKIINIAVITINIIIAFVGDMLNQTIRYYMTSDVKFLHMIFLYFFCSKAKTFFELK